MAQTITITLEDRHIWRLQQALMEGVMNWNNVAHEASMGRRPNASPEGALLLAQDTQECYDIITNQLQDN